MGDMNTDLKDGQDAEMTQFMKESRLSNVMTKVHKHKELPSTFDRGKKCIDLLGISDNPNPNN